MNDFDRCIQPIQMAHVPDLKRLWSAYLSELADLGGDVELGMEMQDDWWTKPEDLFGFTLLAKDVPVGFLLVLGKRYTEAIGETTEFHLHEMYVVPKHRGTGLARNAVREVLNARPGTWSLHAFRTNERALRFWRSTLAAPAYALVEGTADDGGVSFHFRVPQQAEDSN